jgi:hypothetical protein
MCCIGFGWLNDPVLSEVQSLLDAVAAKTGIVVPWSAAVAGAANNYTSIEDARRRHGKDTLKTGKKNKNQVSQYVRYQNMTELYTCISTYKAAAPYQEGIDFPACPHFQYEWSDAIAESKGYTKPFATEFANGIRGTDAQMFGRPVRTGKLQVFIQEIYRSAYLEEVGNMDWNGVSLKRFGLQDKDMFNASMNSANAQYYAYGPSGLENATTAANVPIFISFPHFFRGSRSLVTAVKGLHPQSDIHETYVAVEPQTGLLVKARKRLQVNYRMESYALPEIAEDSVQNAALLCSQLQDIVTSLSKFPGVNSSTLPDITCNLTVVTPLFTCLAQPSNWSLHSQNIFMPYGWVSEEMDLSDSKADELNDSLFAMDDVAGAVRFWSLIVAAACFCMLVVMAISMHIERRQSLQSKLFLKKISSDALGFTFDLNSTMNAGTEPLLGPPSAPNQSYAFDS